MNKIFMSGNHAFGEAAIRAGCRGYFGYPITPQNELGEYMAEHLPENGGVFVQSESETAAINMVIGAAAAGARVMTSSSSPGISLMLENLGYNIAGIITSGEEALASIGTIKPDLIIMDIMLGGPMDGVETARIIKEQYGIRVIFSSGSSEDATLTRVQKIRPAGFILKSQSR